MSNENANTRINSWLEKIVAIGLTCSVSAISVCGWQLYKSNEELKNIIEIHDSKINELYLKHTELKSELSEIRGQMVGWDTLKRMELFMMASPQEADKKMSSAIHMELESRRQKRE